ncbi:MAG: ABC transporter ATP-binding protein/permease, partial [Candidatus Altiarchaeota archaeon]|nr:ABC transporter ATP-binding protein/permease [Candidatus Altiarchaeota archaeon]
MVSVTTSDVDYGYVEMASYLLSFVKPYKFRLVVAVLFSLTGEAASLFPAYALGKMTDFLTTYTTGQSIDYIIMLLVLWLLSSLYRALISRAGTLFGFRVAESMGLDAKVAAMKHIFSLDLSWHESDYAGSKMQRVTNGTQGITNLTKLFFTDLLGAFVAIAGAAAIMFYLKIELAVGLVAFAGSYYLLSFLLRRRQSKQLRIVQTARESAGGVNFESISNINLIKIMDLKNQVLERVIKVNTSLSEEVLKLQKQFRMREMITTIYAVSLKFLILIYISYGIYSGLVEVGVFVMFYVYFDSVLRATAGMSRVADQMLEEKIAVGRLSEMMHETPTVEVSGSMPMPDDWKQINVTGLSFSYPERAATVKNVSFTISRREKVGVVGPTGAGKSTLFKLMLKLDERYSGDILVDDLPLRGIDRRSYIEKIAVVPQETEVFNATLRENIEITGGCEQNLGKALDMANLKGLTERLPDGIETVVGEKGVKLSGGEKQRLSIARAFYKCPQILFLDEPTSQLDSNSELKIQDSLRKVFKDVTAIVIAHRLSTIQEMDKIIVLKDGEIVEQ